MNDTHIELISAANKALDKYYEDGTGQLHSMFILETAVKNFEHIEQKFKTGDRVLSELTDGLAGKVVQSYYELDAQIERPPHIRYKVKWDWTDTHFNSEVEDLCEMEIKLYETRK